MDVVGFGEAIVDLESVHPESINSVSNGKPKKSQFFFIIMFLS
jgi:hypothetical protein